MLYLLLLRIPCMVMLATFDFEPFQIFTSNYSTIVREYIHPAGWLTSKRL